MMMMEEEEFQESDVIFSGEYDSSSSCGSNEFSFNNMGPMDWGKKQRKKQKSVLSLSAPIRIHSNMSISLSTDSSDEDNEEDQVLPPHLIVARRIEERMTFSVQAGYGRPASKGRELSQVRNSILRMTGFLEA